MTNKSNQKRYHPPNEVLEHPMVQQAFKVIGAMMLATNGKDLEGDFIMYATDGHGHQFHIEVTKVDSSEPS